MYSILDYAFSFPMKKIAGYKRVLDPYVRFLFTCVIDFHVNLRSVSSFKWGWEKHSATIKQKDSFQKRI